jgi:translation initiation factor IF-3
MQHHKIELKDHDKIYINEEVRFPEVRVVSDDGNLGVMSSHEALETARAQGLDLIVVSAKANPPVAKIIDYGKFTYEQKKKNREVKKNSFIAETKNVQVKIGTGDRDKRLKVERTEQWLLQGHRVKVDLFLWGRYKYMEAQFLTERLQRFLEMVRVPYKLAEPIQKTPKGFGCTLERDKTQPVPELKKLTGKHAEKDTEEEVLAEIEDTDTITT